MADFIGSPFLRSPAFERAVEQRLKEIALNRAVRLERLRHLNPFDLSIMFDGSGVSKILERDWSSKRRQGEANARQAEVKASSCGENPRFKRDVHDAFRRALVFDQLRSGSEDAARLLSGEVHRSLGRLADVDMEVELQEVREDYPENKT